MFCFFSKTATRLLLFSPKLFYLFTSLSPVGCFTKKPRNPSQRKQLQYKKNRKNKDPQLRDLN
ncbi:hypothetical protein AAZX31_18G142100 [Glycine max]